MFCVTTDSFQDLETETSEIIQETPLSGCHCELFLVPKYWQSCFHWKKMAASAFGKSVYPIQCKIWSIQNWWTETWLTVNCHVFFEIPYQISKLVIKSPLFFHTNWSKKQSPSWKHRQKKHEQHPWSMLGKENHAWFGSVGAQDHPFKGLHFYKKIGNWYF